MNRLLTICVCLFFEAVLSAPIFNYVPGALYYTFAPNLRYAQKIELMKIVFNPKLTKSTALKQTQDWAHEQSPLTEQMLDRAIYDYESWMQLENNQFFDHAEKFSEESKSLGLTIRSTLMNMDLSEFKTCQLLSEKISSASEETRKELGVEKIDCKEMFKRLRQVFDVHL
ncbi:hypothetical protein M3Y97_00527300 [Aphelenchoides bicaudatus]|nr:hypothetical protein M3Y97_00527300 [Aphelenchoides bicaudatus]